jgi:hypothetical protein
MKRLVPFAAIALALAGSTASAGQPAPRVGEARGPAAPASASAEQAAVFRADFNRLLDRYEELFRKMSYPRGIRMMARARESFAALDEHLLARTVERLAVTDLSPAIEAVEDLDALVVPRRSPPSATPGFPDAPPILGACDAIPHDPAFTFAALVAFQVARAVIAGAEFACNQVVVVLGEGGNTSLACVPLAIAADAAGIPWELADFCGGEEDTALMQGSYDRLAHIHDDIEAAKQEIIANDNANRDIILGEIRNLMCDLMRVDHTPHGQRRSNNPSCAKNPAFPFDWPEHPLF